MNNKKERMDQIESLLHDAIVQHKTAITIPTLMSYDEIQRCISRVMNEDPTAFSIHSMEIRSSLFSTVIRPVYVFSEAETHSYYEQCKKKAKHIISGIPNLWSDYDKCLYVHDQLVGGAMYADGDMVVSHSMLGPMIYHRGVCDGFSKAYKFVLDMLGVPCILIKGSTQKVNAQNECDHTWNMINIEGKWYHADLTFDITCRAKDEIRYDYFCLNDEEISVNHFYRSSSYPLAFDDTKNYYAVNGLCIRTVLQFNNYILNCCHAGMSYCLLQIPNSVHELESQQAVLNALLKIIPKQPYGVKCMINLNPDRNVYFLSWGEGELQK